MKKYYLFSFIFVGIFIFGFVIPQTVLAAPCSINPGNSDGSACTIVIKYDDPNIGNNSGLKTCKYQVVKQGNLLSTWYIAPGICTGNSAEISVTINIPSDPGISDSGVYDVWKQATDDANNSSGPINISNTLPVNVSSPFSVDLISPTASISGAPVAWQLGDATSTVSCSDGGGSLCDTASYRLKSYSSAGSCSSIYSDYTLSSPEAIKGHQWLCAAVKDRAGNVGISSQVEFKVDKVSPTVSLFEINGINNSLDPVVATGSITVSWTVGDLGGSKIKEVQVWKNDGGGWVFDATITAPLGLESWSGSTVRSPGALGTYFYGIHIVDNSGNEITEGVLGPIEVQYLAPPIVVTLNAGSIGGTSAVLNGSLSSDGGEPSKVNFKWGDLNINDNTTIAPSPISSPSPFSSFVSGFEKGKAYHFQAKAENQAGISTNNDQLIFITLPDAPSNLFAVDSGPFAINLNWNKGIGAVRTILRRKTGSFPTSPTDGSFVYNGTGISAIDTGLTESTTYYYSAWSEAEEEGLTSVSTSFDTVIESTIAANVAPSISSVSDAPDPSKAGIGVVFNTFWSDFNGDAVKLFICKTNGGVSSNECQGGVSNRWCKDIIPTNNPPATCSYTTKVIDEGVNNYYAYVCDSSLCSSSASGSFLVDATPPTIISFDVTPVDPVWVNNISSDVTISWDVSDSGGSFLKEVQIFNSINGGVDWNIVSTVSAPLSSNSWTNFTIDTPSSSTYLYGLHVLDNVGNETTESEAGFTPIEIKVDTIDPIAAVTDPIAGMWFNGDFVATFEDSDSGGSGLVSSCEYSFAGLDPSGTYVYSPNLIRNCGLDTKTISVGALDFCKFEGLNKCLVETRAFDIAGNTSGWQGRNFSVDFTKPIITNIQPSSVQAGVVETITGDLIDPIGSVIGCSLFTAPVGSSTWTTDSTIINPVPCENGGLCTVSADHIFPDSQEYQIMFGCSDEAGNTGYGSSTTQSNTLSVSLEASPSSGTLLTSFDLKAVVSGTMSGPINYKFDCTSDGIWELEVNGEASSVYTAGSVCSYSSNNTYIAKVLVERGVGSVENTVSIDILPNSPPSAINLQDNNSTVNYCNAGTPPIILAWEFSDPNLPGDSQTAYRVQVDTDSGFSSPIVDSGKIVSSNSSFVPLNLSYNTSYWWRVIVWDESDNSSSWAIGNSFTTPVHVYPTPSFSWNPLFPGIKENVQFTDETIFDPISINQNWLWDFGDNKSSNKQNPTHKYKDTISYTVNLTATDDAGSCNSSQIIRVLIPLPEWSEISPF